MTRCDRVGPLLALSAVLSDNVAGERRASGRLETAPYFEDDHVELYDLANEAGEENDLAERMPDKAAELRGLLEAWLKDTDAQLPQPNPDFGKKRK